MVWINSIVSFYDEIDKDIILLADNDDILNIEQTFGDNGNWEEPVSIEYDFSIEEILDMPTEQILGLNEIKSDIKQEVNNMLTEMKLLAEDVKGSMVDTGV